MCSEGKGRRVCSPRGCSVASCSRGGRGKKSESMSLFYGMKIFLPRSTETLSSL